MKKLAIGVMLLGLVVLVPALSQDEPTRPNGVTADEWVAISDNLGLVVISHKPGKDDPPLAIGDRTVLLATPPLNGYFMVRRGKTWQRLAVLEPVRG